MPMYKLLEYSKSYSKTRGSLWNYYRDERNRGANNNINYLIQNSKFFDYNTEKEADFVVPLKIKTISQKH